MIHDPVPAHSIQHVENERVRVTEWRFPLGAATGFHVHEYDYTIVPLSAGKMRLTGPDGDTRDVTLMPGVSYFRPAGTAHNVENIGETAFAFVEVELK